MLPDEEGKPEEPPDRLFSSPFLSLGFAPWTGERHSLGNHTLPNGLGFDFAPVLPKSVFIPRSAVNRCLFKALTVCELYWELGLGLIICERYIRFTSSYLHLHWKTRRKNTPRRPVSSETNNGVMPSRRRCEIIQSSL